MRITAQLIHARADRHLWADEYVRDLRDILGLQREVARTIANQIQVKLTPVERARLATTARPVNPEAYDLYLKGRYHWNKRTEQDLLTAARYFFQAIEKDPNSALGYADFLSDSSVAYVAALAHTYAVAGDRTRAASLLAHLKRLSMQRYVSGYWIAEIHAALGEIDQAFEWLEQAYQEPSSWLVYLKVDPRLDPLRSDARFDALLEKVGLKKVMVPERVAVS